MRAPVRPISGRWPSAAEDRLGRFFWADPTVILDNGVTPAQFRAAMSAIYVGGTIKITGTDRHPAADQLLIDNVDLADAAIVEMGASDGSTSVDLIGRLPGFRSFTITDLYLTVTAKQVGNRTFLYDHDGRCILIAGNRVLSWPSISTAVRVLNYPWFVAAARSSRPTREALLLNPTTRAMIDADHRISYRVHDIFRPWTGPRPDVIKVANVLRRLYFSETELRAALGALLQDLPEGGHLLVAENPRAKVPGCGTLYRRAGDRFESIAATDGVIDVAELVPDVRLTAGR